ncbi:Hsp20/alpha crystallin family protein [Oxalobacter aliiformigenes]|uniref:Hsp20/alpha crystallin family protein n=1 Tax=Oxalobacter aliiformigenes TaxID=2946593 RepID=A0A9E9LDC3_9BURK|nr:Hsp20/alpha crystallin family protein [Oxalobacter aliiformigenes]WAV91106.1 Hsp20/alpha crystallin family protein [Oxalobacter aliiformigenes]WAV93186.1 Hsp20/alpha crystallin family protein [Oxalobacter aliiformigenes]WAV95310.1 Hsp20/alpha crystallin family protein [Oxalobacter aliiformigenes]WAV96889.1 Hsp20/alpha crystallin family protein [Oxalobacter aliiformigenes]
MLDSLKEAGKSIGRELTRAWESLSDGWRELLSRCGSALVRYERPKYGNDNDSFPYWGLINAEVEETASDLVVRVEMPGVGKENFSIQIVGNTLFIRGEKQLVRENGGSTYHLVERAYGSFERTIALPKNVDSEKSQANYVDGVLAIRLPKAISETVRNIPVE